MKINLKFIYALILITSLSFAQKENDNLFKTDEVAIVIKNDSINLDEYKSLILIPGGAQFRKYFETINYFDKFQTFDEFDRHQVVLSGVILHNIMPVFVRTGGNPCNL